MNWTEQPLGSKRKSPMMRNSNIMMANSSLDGYESPINQYANAKIKLKKIHNISINSANINASMTTIVTNGGVGGAG
jgi:hypothetical protein